MASSDIYTFVDSNATLTEVTGDQLNFISAWSANAPYNRFDVVTNNHVQFVCLAQNIGQAPPASAQFNRYWSLIVLTGGAGSGGGGGSGTNSGGGSVPEWVMEWVGQTFTIAVAGTNAVASALSAAASAQSAASAAQSSASSAQSTATTAISTANTAQSAATTANAAAAAALSAATTAQSTANASQATADAATTAANRDWAYAGQAWSIAVAGTNAAAAASSLATTALQAGTNAAAAALSVATTALQTAWSGTHSGKSLVFCAGFTPLTLGVDSAELVVPYSPVDGTTSLAWTTRRLVLRVQSSGSQSDLAFEKSTGSGVFSAVSVGTVTLPFGAYEASTTTSLTGVASGDKMRFNVLNLGSAQNWTVIAEISNP